METDAILGCIIVTASLVSMTALVLWSRRTINHVSRNKPSSAREILRDLQSGGQTKSRG